MHARSAAGSLEGEGAKQFDQEQSSYNGTCGDELAEMMPVKFELRLFLVIRIGGHEHETYSQLVATLKHSFLIVKELSHNNKWSRVHATSRSKREEVVCNSSASASPTSPFLKPGQAEA